MLVEEFPFTNEKIHPNILLTKETIHNKPFKKRVFGGYDIDEVNSFLDLIYMDYRFIEEELIKEIKMHKIDMK